MAFYLSPQNALRPHQTSALNPTLQNVPHSNKGSSKTCLLLVFPRKVPGTETVLFHSFKLCPTHLSFMPRVTFPPHASSPSKPAHPACLPIHTHPSLLRAQHVCTTHALIRCALGLLFTLQLHSILLINNYLLRAYNI